jgi:hypothetical protein
MAPPGEHAALVRNVCVSYLGAALLAAAVIVTIVPLDGGALCGGRRYETSAVPNGASPYIELSADGLSGPFLLDTGATRSSLSASAFAAPAGSVRRAAVSLPGLGDREFELARYDDLPHQPSKGQIGVLGTDVLSRLTVQLTRGAAFLGDRPCRPDGLKARGLIPIAQNGFFSSDPSKVDPELPNVPVVYVALGEVRAWAQVDTGYDDIVHPHSVDINEALYERLVRSGVKLERTADIAIWTCEGRESRPVYRVRDRPLVVENEQARPIVETQSFYLIVKPSNGCGGIAALETPAAQLGASFLRLVGTVLFDPKSGTVWTEGAQ